MILNLPFFWGK